MYTRVKLLIFLLRVGLGWIFFYSGLSKILAGNWSAAPYLQHAKTLPGLFAWFAQSGNIGWVSMVNEWGQLLIGSALILGVFVNLAAFAGVLLMALYYLPILSFPYVGQTGYLVDEHVMYTLLLLLLVRVKAGRYFGLGAVFDRVNS